ncbi:hypothetical protein ACQP10_37920 (plasmid) [Streptosporangium sandarakinum]|uniref:hypothetical protein n=1 Tax=Streptosporangium sandarakinum TaxID=1260955 RepID=UPI003D8C7390
MIIGRDADRVYNEMYGRWVEAHGTDPDDDPEFLRAFRRAVGQDPETGIYLETSP